MRTGERQITKKGINSFEKKYCDILTTMDSGWDIILNIFINKNDRMFTEEIFINGNNNEIMITKKLFKQNAK